MDFATDLFYVDLVDAVDHSDLNSIVEVYNSNRDFLACQMERAEVNLEWLLDEMEIMEEFGFHSCKIIEIATNEIIGIIDISIHKEETYLSLLMLRGEYKNRGLGSEIYRQVEAYIKSSNSHSIKLDVIVHPEYDALPFWIKNGFVKVEEWELNSSGPLRAVRMKKQLNREH